LRSYEDNQERIEIFIKWTTGKALLNVVTSTGAAMGVLKRECFCADWVW